MIGWVSCRVRKKAEKLLLLLPSLRQHGSGLRGLQL